MIKNAQNILQFVQNINILKYIESSNSDDVVRTVVIGIKKSISRCLIGLRTLR